ncbi:MAG: T9SS type B sorting domain-containing protein [Bacteroidetes bacterium]|nr:T9SS type B sorting domain-containing protein [Bacteroidota bacterium]
MDRYILNNKVRSFFKIIVFSFTSNAYCQLAVSIGSTPQQLVQNVLVGGGISVSNVTYTGSSSQIGSFSGGNSTNLGLSNGIVMSSGVVNGTLFSPSLGSPVTDFADTQLWNFLTYNGDHDIEALTGSTQTSFDASVLEFDFIPLSDTVKFKYVFASEEYPEWVCGDYNDAFGFFISGPGINGPYSNNSINIANIPGTTLPVAISSINNGSAGENVDLPNCISLSYSMYYVDNEAMNGGTIVFDGFTTVLTAWCVVTPCQQYHIKLAVSDLGDANLDSGVFLEAGSFTSASITATSSSSNSTLINDSTAIEGCTESNISFKRAGISITNALTLHLDISGSATNGVDYTLLPDSITFPAGQTTATLIIHPISDGIAEGTENIILSMSPNQNCANIQMETKSYIVDQTPLSVTLTDDTTFICPLPVNLNILANPSGGNGAYSYLWDNGLGTDSSIQVSPNSTTTYSVSVTDACSTQQVVDSVTINFLVSAPLQLSVTGDTLICSQTQQSTITALASGGVSPYTYNWNQTLGSGSTFNVSPPQTTTYKVTVTDTCGINTKVGTITVKIQCPVEIPNVFTPNRDNKNDVFFIKNIDQNPNSKLLIYNRWGAKVYESNNYQNNWDGSNNSDGTYFYILTLSNTTSFKGTITLLRN